MGMHIADAQKITDNFINEHGVRIIRADMNIAEEEGRQLGISLSYHETSGIENYYISLMIPQVSSYMTVRKDAEIMFKTVDDKIVKGLAVYGKTKRTSLSCMYVITPETAALLAQSVTKMRIHYTAGEKESFFDIITDSGYLQRYLQRAYDNIQKTIPLPVDYDKSVF